MKACSFALGLVIASTCLGADPKTLGPAKVVVVADAGFDSTRVVSAIREASGSRSDVNVLVLPDEDPINPIAKGRLLAGLQRADLVVPIADRATAFVLKERESVPVYFVGAASLVNGSAVTAPEVSGILSYNIGESLTTIRSMGWSPLGIAATPGFAAIADAIEQQAGLKGIATIRRTIEDRSAVGPTVRTLIKSARVVWIVGDPLLTRGAGFEFLIEQSLAAKVPVVAPARWEATRGALIGTEPSWEAIATVAGAGVRAFLTSGPRADGEKLASAPPGGTFFFNRTLAEKWNLAVPSGSTWKPVR